jgi:hypothetical protein
MSLGIVPGRAGRLLDWRSHILGFLAAAVLCCGCGGGTRSVATAEVSGRVLYKGKPLPGGRITFVADDNAFASGGTIDENGNYKVSVPVGDTHIAVDNRSLERGRGAPRGGPLMGHQQPQGEGPTELKGQYVPIPAKYYASDQSGLAYKVTSGAQSHDVNLD